MRQVIRVLKTPVTLLLLLAILGYGAYWGLKNATADASTPEAACVVQDVGGTLTSDKVSVRVLNGGEKGGAAKNTRFYLLSFGYHIVSYNNSDREVDKVTIVGNAADDPEVKLVAQAFKAPVVTEGDGRADHVVDVIVPTKFELVAAPPKSIAVTGPVCLPVITSASATDSASPSATPSARPTTKKT